MCGFGCVYKVNDNCRLWINQLLVVVIVRIQRGPGCGFSLDQHVLEVTVFRCPKHLNSVTYKVEPSGIDFWQLVGIGIGFLLKCRFSVGIGFGFGIEKSGRFFSVLFRFFGFFSKHFFVVL
jgi:hypothetical protein